MPLVPRRGILAIAAVIDIALHASTRPSSAKSLAMRYQLAPRHLEPLLQTLVHRGLLKGIRGPRGGYELGRDAKDITVANILDAALSQSAAEHPQFAESPLVSRIVVPAVEEAEQTMAQAFDHITIGALMQRAIDAGVHPG
ncbi:MAG: Rrf2 family transcriptional regulator [Xanthobacteraceae bacterium]|nr:MAG: Rrf2 family transcriptional regulator [Xanthobacteraceae bacterium]